MTIENIVTSLNSIVDTIYEIESTKQNLPYLVYYESGSSNFVADNVVYFKRKTYTFEFYSSEVNENKEQQIENVFQQNKVPYEGVRVFLDFANVYQTKYEVTI